MRIRTFLLSLGILLIALSPVRSQDLFEGTVIYKIVAESEDPNFNSDAFNKSYGDELEFIFREGNYESRYNGQFTQPTFYFKLTNKLYFQNANPDLLEWKSCNRTIAKVERTENKENAETILGTPCNSIKLFFAEKSKDGKITKHSVTYYFSKKEMPINGLWMNKHKMFHYDKLYRHLGALPMKMVFEREGVTKTYTVKTIDPHDVKYHFKELERIVDVSDLQQRMD